MPCKRAPLCPPDGCERHDCCVDRPAAEPRVTIELPRPAAEFLRATVVHMNQAKILPPNSAEALQTSAWLEEIEARVASALSPQQSGSPDA